MSEQDNRVFSRINFDAGASIIAEGHEWVTTLLDISLKGALVQQPDDWQGEVGMKSLLHITLSEEIVIDMQATVSHIENGHIGFRCDHIDLESITHLRRIVELNTGNEDLLHRELSALRGS